jgi:hypothetical protein
MKKLNDAKQFDKALSLYDQHEKPNPLLISNKVVTQALKASTKLLDRQRGLTISKKIPLSSMDDSYLLASLIHMFSKLFFLLNICFFLLFLPVEFNMIDKAVKIFEESKIRSESMFTTIIKGNQRIFFGKDSLRKQIFNQSNLGYLKHQMPEKAFDLFSKISNPSEILLIQIFNTCAQLGNSDALNYGKTVFDQMSIDCQKNSFLMNSAFNVFIKCGEIAYAERIFSKIKRFVIGYGRLMKTFNLENKPEKTIDLYEQMKRDQIQADRIIYLLLINACSQIGFETICQRIVQEISKDYLLDYQIQTALIHMWVRFSSFDLFIFFY